MSRGGENRTVKRQSQVIRNEKVIVVTAIYTDNNCLYIMKKREHSKQTLAAFLREMKLMMSSRFWYDTKSHAILLSLDSRSLQRELIEFVSALTGMKIWRRDEDAVYNKLARYFLFSDKGGFRLTGQVKEKLFQKLCKKNWLDFCGTDVYSKSLLMTKHERNLFRTILIGLFYLKWGELKSSYTKKGKTYKGLKNEERKGRIFSVEVPVDSIEEGVMYL